ncbi:hypothetical protein BSKO_03160 [Bryopsis sp. KO-2023]|nr:hypothetical protein BSKO_03160 [Bryopsis sp. KO-2023]
MDLQAWALGGVVLAVSYLWWWWLNFSRCEGDAEKPVIRLDDIANPQYRAIWVLANYVGDLLGLWPMYSVDEFVEEAKRRSGLSDLGDESEFPFREGLTVLLESCNDPNTHMTALGRLRFHELVVQLLVNRLRIQEKISKHPEILSETVEKPIFIAGLPRSGTTHLYWILANHDKLRSCKFFEMVEPVMKFDFLGWLLWDVFGYDYRLTRGTYGYWFSQNLRPDYQAIHDSGPDRPEEDMMLTAITFQCIIFSVFLSSEKYLNWYKTKEPMMPTKYLKRVLQVLQWQDRQLGLPQKRWLLKSIDHIQHIEALREVFPDATIVQTHREPVTVVTSAITLVTYGCGMSCTPIDLKKMGTLWASFIETMLRDFVNSQKNHKTGKVCNVLFNDFVADNIKEVERVLEIADVDFDGKNRKKMELFSCAHQQYRRGKVMYNLARFGLDKHDLEKKLRFYATHFGVADRVSN